MDNALMLGLQTQMVLQRRMDIAANNMANMNTSGFKADALVLEEKNDTEAHADYAPEDIRFVRDVTVMRGALTSNINTLLQQTVIMVGSIVVMVVIIIRVNYCKVSFNAVKACPDYFFHAIPSLIYMQQTKLMLLWRAAYHLKFGNINSLPTVFSYN